MKINTTTLDSVTHPDPHYDQLGVCGEEEFRKAMAGYQKSIVDTVRDRIWTEGLRKEVSGEWLAEYGKRVVKDED